MPSWKKVVLHGSSGSLAHLKLENLTSQSVLGTDANGNVVAGSVSGYSLPVATSSTLGGIKVGNGLTMNGGTGVLSVNSNITASKLTITADSSSAQVYGIYFGTVGSNASPKGDSSGINYFPFTQTTTIKNLSVANNISVNGTVDGRDIAGDGTKLDGLIAQTSSFLVDTVYTLPIATTTVLGGIKIGSGLTVNKTTGVVTAPAGTILSADRQNFYSGSLSLTGNGATSVTYSSQIGGFIISSTDTDTTYSNATTSTAGLMSSTDKTKLDGIAASANNYSLPIATASALGGIKIGSGLSINSETGVLSANVQAGTILSANRRDYYSGSLNLTGGGATTVTYSAEAGGFVISSTDTDTDTWRPLGTGATDAAAGNHLHDDRYLKIADTGSIIDYIVASAPGTLDTLNEIAAAIGDDANFSGSIAKVIAGKADSSHTHDDRYYTETEVDTLLAGKQAAGTYLTSLPSHNHDDRYYTETEADSRFVNASGDTMTGGLYGSNAILGNWITDSMPESATFFDSRLVNDLAYAGLRGKSVSSNYFSAASLNTILNGAGDFISLGQDSIPDGGVVIEIEAPRQLNYGCKYGIMFGNTSWMTDYVKLESYRNGAWQTDLEVSGNRSHILMTSVIGNNHLGATRFRFTVDRPVYTTSIRIANVFAFNYNSIGARELYVTRDGGSIYSDLSINGNLTITGTVDGRDIATDGTKLDGIAANANNYSLPVASASTLGGIKVGTNLSIDANGVLSSTDTNTVTSVGITGDLTSGNITLAGSGATTITKSGGTITITSTDTDTTYSNATTERAGLMSTTDKTKLDGIAASANNYSLPVASASTLGGIKIGTNLSIDTNGVVSSTDTNTWRPLGTGATDAAAGNHTHDDRYYTETESDTRFARKDSTDSADLLGLVTVNVDMTLRTDWQATSIRGNTLSTGTYIVQVYVNDYAVGGGHYTEYYSGTMSWYGTTTNSTVTDEIVLHRAGHAPNSGRIYLRTKRTPGANDGNMYLEMAGDSNNTGSSRYVFKFRRLI